MSQKTRRLVLSQGLALGSISALAESVGKAGETGPPHRSNPYHVNVADFGARGDGVSDDTDAVEQAIRNCSIGSSLFFPGGEFRIRRSLDVSGLSVVGSSSVLSNYTDRDPRFGTILRAEIPSGHSVLVSHKPYRHFSIERITIDLKHSNPGSDRSNFAVKGITAGISLRNCHNFVVRNVAVYNIPAAGAGVIGYGGSNGLYWGYWENVYINYSSSSTKDPSSKGFVFVGEQQPVTSQVFLNCVSYRGWYLKNVEGSQWINCAAEDNPADGVLMEASTRLTFIGGYFEGNGLETERKCFQFNGMSQTRLLTLVGVALSGNGIHGVTELVELSTGGVQLGDGLHNRIGSWSTDGAGNTQTGDTSFLGFVSGQDGLLMPPGEKRVLLLSAEEPGFDVAGEYTGHTGVFSFRCAPLPFRGTTGSYLVSVCLHFDSTSDTRTGDLMFLLDGEGFLGSKKLFDIYAGPGRKLIQGTLAIRLVDRNFANLRFVVSNEGSADARFPSKVRGDYSDSWISISKIA